MLRTTRPLLSSSARAVVPRGRPVCPPRAFTTFTSTEGRMQRVNGPRRPATLWPLVWRTTFATKPPQQPTGVDKELEKEIAKKKIEARPEEVSTQSSVRHAFEGSPGSQLNEQDITTSVAADLVRCATTHNNHLLPVGNLLTSIRRKLSRRPSRSIPSRQSPTPSVSPARCRTWRRLYRLFT